MEHEFSEGFINDIAFLLEECKNDETDNCELVFTKNGKKLWIEIRFSMVDENEVAE